MAQLLVSTATSFTTINNVLCPIAIPSCNSLLKSPRHTSNDTYNDNNIDNTPNTNIRNDPSDDDDNNNIDDDDDIDYKNVSAASFLRDTLC